MNPGNEMHHIQEGLAFDDVLLVPSHSDVVPAEVSVQATLGPSFALNIPLLSSPMDTVTTSPLAIALAALGGLGVIHKNMTPEQQAEEIVKVKRWQSGVVFKPYTLAPDDRVSKAFEAMAEKRISGFPVCDPAGRLVGILTNRDLRLINDPTLAVRDVMTSKNLVTADPEISLTEAKQILHHHRIEKLPLVDADGLLRGLITFTDITKRADWPNALLDSKGRLRVGGAVGAGLDSVDRAEHLVRAGVDLLVVDTAHGHSRGVLEQVDRLRSRWPQLTLVVGNVVTPEAVDALADAGADVVKVGVGPGSICTTRVVAGVGVPQFSAILSCAKAARRRGVGLIADGGIKYSGDIAKALGAGADAVMIGALFAGTDESPGEVVLFEGRSYKSYRGMGSVGAMQHGSRDRYFQGHVRESGKFIPEGIEAQVPSRGPLRDTVHQLVGGLKTSMGYVGAPDLVALRERARFVRITAAGIRESHPHGVTITKEAPNYHIPH